MKIKSLVFGFFEVEGKLESDGSVTEIKSDKIAGYDNTEKFEDNDPSGFDRFMENLRGLNDSALEQAKMGHNTGDIIKYQKRVVTDTELETEDGIKLEKPRGPH